MRKLWLCSAVAILAVSVCAASELQFDMFPGEQGSLDIELFGSEAKSPLDFDLFAGVTCPCPDGPCICDPEKCICPDCPEHQKEKPTVWAGKPNENGRHGKIVSSDECVPCQKLKTEVRDQANHLAIENYATLKGAGEAGYDELPQCKLYQDGDLKLILVGGACKPERIKEWLEESEPKTVTRSTTQAATYSSGWTCSGGVCRSVRSSPVYTPTQYNFRPASGPIYYQGCSSCRR